MALNKAKVLKLAEKYVLQGKISSAISEYQKLIREDPTDLPLVNTLGDLYVRIGNISEAVKCFTRLAESYDNGGFVVRAIAMYKKVGKIDPGQVQALSRLADLYLRQGLVSDARAHYVLVADYYLRKGDKENAVSALKTAVQADPENPLTHLKLFETYSKLGQTEAAGRSMSAAAEIYRKKGQLQEAENCLRQAYQLDGSNQQVVLGFARVLNDLSNHSEALAVVSGIQFQEFNPEALETTFEIYLKSGQLSDAEKTANQLLEVDSGYFRPFLALGKRLAEAGDLNAAVEQLSKSVPAAVEKGAASEVESELKAILALNSNHVPSLLALVKLYNQSREIQNIPALLERLGSLFINQDKLVEAASIYSDLAAMEPANPAHRENLRQIKERLGPRGEAIDLPRLLPEMSFLAEKFVSEPTLATISPDDTESPESPAADSESGYRDQIKSLLVEGDLFVGYGLYQKAVEQFKKGLDLVPNHLELHERIRDTYAKLGELGRAAEHCLVLAKIYTSREDHDNAKKNFTLAYQYNPNLHQEPILGAGQKGEEAPDDSPRTTAEARRQQELLEEIDFYLDQQFLSEAKGCIDEYLRLGPVDDALSGRLERYDALNRVSPTTTDDHREEVSEAEVSVGAQELPEFESTTVSPPEATEQEPSEVSRLPELEPTSHEEIPQSEPPRRSLSEPFAEMMIDLDEELETSILEKPAAAAPPGPEVPADSGSRQGTDSTGLEDIFAEFKEDLEDDSEAGDYETHYNLGIAFKEMGLLEEAIAEFQKALKGQSPDGSGEEFVRCCNMLGLCFVEKGLPQVGVKWFSKALASPGCDEETYQALRYYLACAYEQAGNHKAALEAFLDVYGVNINYRDVAEKIDNLKKVV
ncbi:MAG: tetratricopeptide repeat protein [Acidobacteriota bacterium]